MATSVNESIFVGNHMDSFDKKLADDTEVSDTSDKKLTDSISLYINEEMTTELLKIISQAHYSSQTHFIAKVMSTNLFQQLMSKLMNNPPTKNHLQNLNYLERIFQPLLMVPSQATATNMENYLHWCINNTSTEDNKLIIEKFQHLKDKMDEIKERQTSFQYLLPFHSEDEQVIKPEDDDICGKVLCQYQHTCPMKPHKKCDPCRVLIEKKYSHCNHSESLPCHIDIEKFECKVPLLRKLKCGHQVYLDCHVMSMTKDYSKIPCSMACEYRLPCGHLCPEKCHFSEPDKHETIVCKKPCGKKICINKHRCTNLCHEECSDCMVLVTKQRQCGHEIQHPCGMYLYDISRGQLFSKEIASEYVPPCKEPCNKTLPCGHLCKNFCSDNCGNCMESVDTTLDCGHVIHTHCQFSDQKVCREECTKLLKCGHKCTNTCRDECTNYCMEEVMYKLKCGHDVSIYCYEKNEPQQPERVCFGPCEAILPCGDKCPGTCNDCRQGRLHVQCKNKCGRQLVCGHLCSSSCSGTCPPCSEKCITRCHHSKCPNPCKEKCMKCVEPCEWKCDHFKCEKMCHEMCDRPRCNEPCIKLLDCGHQCIGLCGEQCPTLCRICNYNQLTDFILLGNEEDKDARFIQLVDCGHCIEVNGLDNWMDANVDEIKMKECPRCKTTIWTSNRYGNVIKKVFKDVRKVKKKIFGCTVEMSERRRLIVEKLERSWHVHKYFKEKSEELLKTVQGKSLMHMDAVIVIENQVNVLMHTASLMAVFAKILWYGTAEDYFSSEIENLIQRMMLEKDVMNESIFKDINKELSRIQFKTMLKEAEDQKLDKCEYYVKSKTILSTLEKLTDEEESEVRKSLHEVFRNVDGYELGVSDDERIMIVEAVGLNKGHWYKCPNGHIYAIGECGRAYENSQCSECGATIGGEDHELQVGNTLAWEMAVPEQEEENNEQEQENNEQEQEQAVRDNVAEEV